MVIHTKNFDRYLQRTSENHCYVKKECHAFYQTLEKYLAGERITPLIDLGNIDRVPVTVMTNMDDTTCRPEQAEFLFD